MTGPGSEAVLRAVERFLVHEARLLDERRFDEWLALFAADGSYWVPLRQGQESPHDHISLMYDDRRLLEARVRRLGNPALHAQQPPSVTSRIVTNVSIETTDGDVMTVRSKFVLVEYRSNRQRVFAGTFWHRLIAAEDDAFLILRKRVDLTDSEGELEGLVVPF